MFVLGNFLLVVFSIGDSSASIPQNGINCDVCHGLYPGMRNLGGGGTVTLGNEVCVGCHSSADGNPVKMLDGIRVPIVCNNIMPASPAAGGNFYYLNDAELDPGGHYVDGVSPPDLYYGGIPPGYSRDSDNSTIGYNVEKPLVCAGSNGCHGNRNIENPFYAIQGTHHAVDLPVNGTTTAQSYRFLKITDSVTGVVGLENADWGINSTPLEHNEYTTAINNLCGQCHGLYHVPGESGGSSPWERHPVGIVLPLEDEFADYNPDAGSLGGIIRQYSLEAPLARPSVPTVSSAEVYPGTDLTLCLSCHSSHGSPYKGMLRWDAKTVIAGQDNPVSHPGCLICHTQK